MCFYFSIDAYSALVLLLLMALKRYYQYLIASDLWVMDGSRAQWVMGQSEWPLLSLPLVACEFFNAFLNDQEFRQTASVYSSSSNHYIYGNTAHICTHAHMCSHARVRARTHTHTVKAKRMLNSLE